MPMPEASTNSTRSHVLNLLLPTLLPPASLLATMQRSHPAASSPSAAAAFLLAQHCARANRVARPSSTVRRHAFCTLNQSPRNSPRILSHHTRSTTRHALFRALRRPQASKHHRLSLRRKQRLPQAMLEHPHPSPHQHRPSLSRARALPLQPVSHPRAAPRSRQSLAPLRARLKEQHIAIYLSAWVQSNTRSTRGRVVSTSQKASPVQDSGLRPQTRVMLLQCL